MKKEAEKMTERTDPEANDFREFRKLLLEQMMQDTELAEMIKEFL